MIQAPIIGQFDETFIIRYAESLVSNAFSGDPTAAIILALLLIVSVALVFEVSSVLFGILKRGFLLIIVGLSTYYFVATYGQKLASEGLTGQLIFAGVIGLAVIASALVISFGSFAKHVRFLPAWLRREKVVVKEPKEVSSSKLAEIEVGEIEVLSRQGLSSSLKDERSILAVLSYVVVAQFGVFSTVTISAPNPVTGMIFFAVFFLAAFVFIRTTYHNYVNGVRHLVIAAVFGLATSIILGIIWAEIPIAKMLSLGYFETEAMVAFVTGIAVSLLMGTKN